MVVGSTEESGHPAFRSSRVYSRDLAESGTGTNRDEATVMRRMVCVLVIAGCGVGHDVIRTASRSQRRGRVSNQRRLRHGRDRAMRPCGAQTDVYISDGTTAGFLKRARITPEVDLSAETYRDAVATTLTDSRPTSGIPLHDWRARYQPGYRECHHHIGAFVCERRGLGNPAARRRSMTTIAHDDGTRRWHDDGTTMIASRTASHLNPTEIDASTALLPATLLRCWLRARWWSGSRASRASVQVMELPATFEQDNLAAFDSMRSSDIPALAVSMVRVTAGYDAVRANVFDGDLADPSQRDAALPRPLERSWLVLRSDQHCHVPRAPS